jgi:hypothetical protein
MLSKWVNVLLPYGQTVLAEQQDAQAALDDEKAKVTRIEMVAHMTHVQFSLLLPGVWQTKKHDVSRQ